MWIRFIAGVGMAASMSATFAQHAPHEHGAATLRVAVDGATVVVEFESPLDNLVGFERAPRTAREREALAAAGVKLKDGAAVFELPAAAGCVIKEADVSMPHGPGVTAAAGDHSDAQAEYTFDCKAPAQLANLRVRLPETFPRLKRVRVDVVTGSGQRRVSLSGKRWDVPL